MTNQETTDTLPTNEQPIDRPLHGSANPLNTGPDAEPDDQALKQIEGDAEPEESPLPVTDTHPDLSDDPVSFYMREIGAVTLLTGEQEVQLAKQIEAGLAAEEALQEGQLADPAQLAQWQHRLRLGQQARRRLAEANLRLVVSVAKHHLGRGLLFQDLIQEGNIGLLKAVERFDYTQGFRFSTYATWWIRQAITRAIADQGRTIRIPVHMTEVIYRISRIERQFFKEQGREPSNKEVALQMDMLTHAELTAIEQHRKSGHPLDAATNRHWRQAADKVRRLKQMTQTQTSLDASVGSEDNTVLADFIEDETAPAPVDAVASALLKEQMREVLAQLTPREQEVLRLRFGLEDGQTHTLEEVGGAFGVTRERVRQIEAKALRKLRHPHRSRHLKDFL